MRKIGPKFRRYFFPFLNHKEIYGFSDEDALMVMLRAIDQPGAAAIMQEVRATGATAKEKTQTKGKEGEEERNDRRWRET